MCYGASRDSRVATYVNRKWHKSSPHIIGGGMVHKDIVLVSFDTSDGPFVVLNVYNDSDSFAAVKHLLHVTQLLPPISIMCGDFNLHHPTWDWVTREWNEQPPHGREVHELLDLAAELQLILVNNEDGPPTWASNDTRKTLRTLDLVWRRGNYEIRQFAVKGFDKHRSNHSPVAWEVVVGSEPSNNPDIGCVPEQLWAFNLAVAKLCASLPLDWDSTDDVEQTGEALSAGLNRLWKEHSVKLNRSEHSKSWWNEECASAAKLLLKVRKQRKFARKMWYIAFSTLGSRNFQHQLMGDIVVMQEIDVKEKAKQLGAPPRGPNTSSLIR